MNKNNSASCLLKEGTYGKVVTTEHCEIDTSNRAFCQIIDSTTIRNIITNQTTQLPMPPSNLVLPTSMQVPNGPLKRYDTPTRRLYYVISHYLRHIDETISRIRNKDYEYLNKSIMSLVQPQHRNEVSHSARETCTYLARSNRKDGDSWEPVGMAVAYAFAHGYDAGKPSRMLLKFKYAGHNVDLTCDDGLVRYDKESSKYYVDSIPPTAKSFREPDLATMVSNVLNGFLVQQSAEEGLKTVGIGKLASQSPHIDDGESFNTIIAGRLFKVTRDRSLQQSKEVTLQRSMGPYEGEEEPTPMEIIASTFHKRRLDYSSSDAEAVKRRVEDQSAQIDLEDSSGLWDN